VSRAAGDLKGSLLAFEGIQGASETWRSQKAKCEENNKHLNRFF
jgi:hypothetical protein